MFARAGGAAVLARICHLFIVQRREDTAPQNRNRSALVARMVVSSRLAALSPHLMHPLFVDQ